MSKANTLAVDFTKAKDVLQILPNGSLLTSRGAQWDGIHLEYYRHPPYEIPENFPKQHLILMAQLVFRGVEKQKRNPARMSAGFMTADPNAQLKPFD